MRTLEQYFKDCLKEGIIDFSIRANIQSEKTTFYIHPSNKDGDTLDFVLEGNSMTTTQDMNSKQG